jgi:hypothetical protein
MLRTAFKLALRQTEGLMTSVLTLMGLTISAPDHSTASRRTETLPVIQPGGGAAWSIARIDRQHRTASLRSGSMAGGEAWRQVAPEMAKLHLAVDAGNGMIVGQGRN